MLRFLLMLWMFARSMSATQEQGTPPDFWGRIQKMIEDAVAKLARSGMLRNASISEGGALTIKGGGQIRALYPESLGGGVGGFFGDIKNAVTGVYLGTGWLFQDPIGRDIAQFRSDAATGTTLATINDVNGVSAVLTDAAGGMGLSRPYLGNGFVPARYADWNISTTSGTFETLHTSVGYRTHAGILAWIRSAMDTPGSTGEIRVLVNGNQLDTADTIAFAQTLSYQGPAVPPGSIYDLLIVEIQGRVASGAGALRVAGGGWISRPV